MNGPEGRTGINPFPLWSNQIDFDTDEQKTTHYHYEEFLAPYILPVIIFTIILSSFSY